MQASFVPIREGLRGYLALPQTFSPPPAVLVYMEAFGVNAYVQSECRRLAEHGYAALAPDFYHGETFAYDNLPTMRTALQQLTDENLCSEVQASIAYLDQHPNLLHTSYGAIGFCMGGRLAFLSALQFPERIGAAASFYGGGIAPDQPRFFPSLAHRINELRAPIMLFYGADDTSILPSEHARLVKLLSEEKKAYTITLYPNAGHAFASADRTSYNKEAAKNAWERALAFFHATLTS